MALTPSPSSSATATATLRNKPVDLTIAAVNDAPVAIADAGFEPLADSAITIQASTLLANDQDIDGDALLIASVGGAINGTVALDTSGNAVFTPNAGYTGAASFTYTASDGNGGTATANVSLDVRPVSNVITGTAGNDILTGTNGDDILDGLGGLDQLHGGAGNDTLIGGPGRDLLDGSSGVDTVDYSNSPGGVYVYTGGPSEVGGGAGGYATGDRLTGIENLIGTSFDDWLLGGNGANTLLGGAGADYLYGGGGSDILDGGSGDDLLSGGRRASDTFIFRSGYGGDTITDFEDRRFAFQTRGAEDILEIDVDGISGLGDVLARATQTGGKVVIDFGGSDTLTLMSTTLAQLGADDFRFV